MSDSDFESDPIVSDPTASGALAAASTLAAAGAGRGALMNIACAITPIAIAAPVGTAACHDTPTAERSTVTPISTVGISPRT
jgi:hypothetical protein